MNDYIEAIKKNSDVIESAMCDLAEKDKKSAKKLDRNINNFDYFITRKKLEKAVRFHVRKYDFFNKKFCNLWLWPFSKRERRVSTLALSDLENFYEYCKKRQKEMPTKLVSFGRIKRR